MTDRVVRPAMPTVDTMTTGLSEEALAELDEPPDQLKSQLRRFRWSPTASRAGHTHSIANAPRRESLLTRQLHSETEPTDNDEPKSPNRALSVQSTWSSISVPSTAELTSDDGHSVPSTTGSPPLPPTRTSIISSTQKPVATNLKIVQHEDTPTNTNKPEVAEQTVEANLGRKRCISFACRGKQEVKPTQPAPEPAPTTSPQSPPKRKCMLKFVCPSRAETSEKIGDKPTSKRPASPAPRSIPSENRRSMSIVHSRHRGSDTTVTNASPKATRKAIESENTPQTKALSRTSTRISKYSDESDEDSGDERTRFHAFATSEDEPEAWTKVSTCHRTRLTVDDTLKKENVIRKTCKEAEEEVFEEEEEEEEEQLEDELAAVEDFEDDDAVDDGDDTDEGFHSDDEGGFASSDSDNDSDSDFEWWKPSGLSTAATSVDQLDRLTIVHSQRSIASTSAGSVSSSPTSPRTTKLPRRLPTKQTSTPAMKIIKPASTDLPDSTDFVCGTLDEDRTLEEEFINRRKQKQAAKRPIRPQDIDPSFPTSDPEMDEEDDDDLQPPAPTDEEADFMHGKIDEIHADGTARRRSPIRRARTKSNAGRSPAPAAIRHHSPAPAKVRPTCHSPPPTTARRSIARSPAPARKLFSQSPNRMTSPAPVKRMTSPPNSPTGRLSRRATAQGLGSRPQLQLTHTSSLPRGGPTKMANLSTIPSDDEDQDSTGTVHADVIPKRGAIDIVKGLEKKRELRKRKLAQKLCAKAANKCDKTQRVRPGIGAERMREIGLNLQEYHGKAEHILSL